MTLRTACVVLASASLVPATAQELPARVPEARQATLAAFEAWRAQRSPAWRIDLDRFSGRATFLGGGAQAVGARPENDADFAALGLRFVGETELLTGLELETLRAARVKFLPLGLVGSNDKLSVAYEQAVAGVPVFEARVHVLFDLVGRVLSLQSTALPEVAGVATTPATSAARARALAAEAFERELGLAPTSATTPRLGIGSAIVGERREARLAWELDVRWSAPGTRPEGRSIWIDARDGSVLRSRPSVHEFDVGGTVTAFATPGSAPDTPGNPPLSAPMKDLRVKSAAGTTYTDAAGAFSFPGLVGPTQITAEFVGRWAHVDNDAGAEEVFIQQLSGTGNSIVLNGAPVEAVTSQANAFVHIGKLRDWVRAVDPTDDAADFQAYARVNLNDVCNAYYDGFSVNFFASGTSGSTSCVNTGFSSVVAHEMGHWLNVVYHTGNGSDGMGEGNADVFAMYLYDTPLVGDGFFGPGTQVRTGLNTTLFCGDCCPNCHGGQVHKQGEVWMGAAWKLRARMNTTHGNALGDGISDGLFSAWLNAYDQTQIKSVIETQWLVLDDDNGDLEDGTPHYADIDGGFRDQGFPGFDLPPMVFSDVTILGDTTDEVGPYVVRATVVPQTSPAVGPVAVHYRVDDGPWIVLPMIPIGTDLYETLLPGFPSVAEVSYYIHAVDVNLAEGDFPEGGADDPIEFVVGLVSVLFEDDFEGPDDGGWTHGSFGDTTNDHDDFQRGAPAGKAGDPGQAFSGSNVWGNDLGGGAWNGAYQNQQHNWLRSPAIDCSSALGTQLRFQRRLGVDAGDADQARIHVNGVEVFANDPVVVTQDGGWSSQVIDIAAIADGQPAVEVEFSLESDAATTFGGWTIDDVEVRYLSPVSGSVGAPYCFGDGSGTACPCSNNASAGAGCANSSGQGAVLVGAGSTSSSADDLLLNGDIHLAGLPALLFSGTAAAGGGSGVVLGDGLLCAGGAITRLDVMISDAGGALSWGPGLAASGGWGAGDQRFLQVWYRDPVGGPCGSDFNLSHALDVTFTP